MKDASVTARPALLPPRGLLLALACQVPAILLAVPLTPSVMKAGAGLVFIASGIALNVWADLHLKRANVHVCPFSQTPVLVRTGPFAVTRNPMYLGLLAISVGVTLASGVLSNLWITASLALWLQYAYVRPEESFLHERFGPEFERYALQVPRWLPGVTRRRRAV